MLKGWKRLVWVSSWGGLVVAGGLVAGAVSLVTGCILGGIGIGIFLYGATKEVVERIRYYNKTKTCPTCRGSGRIPKEK